MNDILCMKTFISSSKIHWIFLLLALSTFSLRGQYIRTSYFMDKSPARTAMNPAFRPQRGYFALPVLGSLNVAYTSNGLAVEDMLYPSDGRLVTFMDPSVDAGEFLGRLGKNNAFHLDVATNVLSMGWYHRKSFWTVDLGFKATAGLNLPKSLFELMKEGSGSQGRTYDISNVRMFADSYAELAVGYSHPIGRKVTVGGRLKFLAGAANVDARIDRMQVSMYGDKWHITSQGTLNASMQGLMAGTGVDDMGRRYIDSFELDSPGIGGYGGAIDFGVSYRVIRGLELSASVLDLGAIQWAGSSTVAGVAEGDFTFDGFDLPIGGSDADPIEDQLDAMIDDLTDLVHFRQLSEADDRLEMLMPTVNFGVEYSLPSDKLSFGLLSSTRFYRSEPYTELTASVNYRPADWFSATASYSILHSEFQSYGFALNFSPSWINLFIASDYMITRVTPQMVPIGSHAVNVHFGLSIPMTRARS